MNILLAGHAGFFNKGCEAIVKTTAMLLRSEFGKTDITLASRDYANDRLSKLVTGIKIIPSDTPRIWDRWSGPWMMRQAWKRCSSEENSLKAAYLPVIPSLLFSDAVLSIGGDNYTMDYGFPAYYLRLNRLVKDAGKKLVIWGASIGPFPDDGRLASVVSSLASADLITVRESVSAEYLRTIGVTRNVRQVADPAFLLPPEEVSMHGLMPEDRDIVGFNVSAILGKYRGDGDNTTGVRSAIDFLGRLIKESDYGILLIPHVTRKDNKADSNDACFMKEIWLALKETGRIGLVPEGFNSQQLKHIISRCRFFIGARTHATIAALSSGVPTISIGYSPKSRGINRDIFGHEGWVVSVNELSGALLFDKFCALTAYEKEIRNVLAQKIPELRQQARKNVTCLKEILPH